MTPDRRRRAVLRSKRPFPALVFLWLPCLRLGLQAPWRAAPKREPPKDKKTQFPLAQRESILLPLKEWRDKHDDSISSRPFVSPSTGPAAGGARRRVPLARPGLTGPRPAGRLRRSRLAAPIGLLVTFLWRAKTTLRSDGETRSGPQGEDPLGGSESKVTRPGGRNRTLRVGTPRSLPTEASTQ